MNGNVLTARAFLFDHCRTTPDPGNIYELVEVLE